MAGMRVDRVTHTLGEQMREASVTWVGALVGLGFLVAVGQPALAADNLRDAMTKKK